MNIKIYTSSGCVWCERMKELMARADLEYTEILWQDLSGDDQVALSEQYPEMHSFPVAIIDDEFVGGLVPVAKKLMQLGLVSAPKK